MTQVHQGTRRGQQLSAVATPPGLLENTRDIPPLGTGAEPGPETRGFQAGLPAKGPGEPWKQRDPLPSTWGFAHPQVREREPVGSTGTGVEPQNCGGIKETGRPSGRKQERTLDLKVRGQERSQSEDILQRSREPLAAPGGRSRQVRKGRSARTREKSDSRARLEGSMRAWLTPRPGSSTTKEGESINPEVVEYIEAAQAEDCPEERPADLKGGD